MLEVRRGKGTFVSPQVEEIGDFGFSSLEQVRGQLRDLFELRSMFEPRCAALPAAGPPGGALRHSGEGGGGGAVHRAGRDRTQADQAFHTAIVRAAHNEFLLRLLPIIHQAVSTAVERGGTSGAAAEDTLRDHALLLEFLKKRDGEGAGARHGPSICATSMDVMGLAGTRACNRRNGKYLLPFGVKSDTLEQHCHGSRIV